MAKANPFAKGSAPAGAKPNPFAKAAGGKAPPFGKAPAGKKAMPFPPKKKVGY